MARLKGVAAREIYVINLRDNTRTSIAIAGEVSAYSQHFELPRGATFAVAYQAASSGTVALKIEMEQSDVLPANTTTPASDGNYVVPDDALEINDTLADKLVHMVAYAPSSTPFARFKITGNSGNDASTTLTKLKLIYIPTR